MEQKTQLSDPSRSGLTGLLNAHPKFTRFSGMTVGTLLMVVGIYFFYIPNGFSIGGVSGIATVVGKLVPVEFITPGTLIFTISMLLLVLGFALLGKKAMMGTLYGSVLYSVSTLVLEWLVPMEHPMTDQPFLELAVSILLTALGSGLLFQCEASSGGTDIVALILRKYTSLDAGKALLATDFLITCGAFFFGVDIGLYSLLGLFAKSFLVDGVMESINVCKSFMIVTDKPEEILEVVMKEMRHSATVVDAKGAYTGESRKIIYTLCRRFEATHLKRRVRTIDPDSFVIVVSTSEFIGKGFRRK